VHSSMQLFGVVSRQAIVRWFGFLLFTWAFNFLALFEQMHIAYVRMLYVVCTYIYSIS